MLSLVQSDPYSNPMASFASCVGRGIGCAGYISHPQKQQMRPVVPMNQSDRTGRTVGQCAGVPCGYGAAN